MAYLILEGGAWFLSYIIIHRKITVTFHWMLFYLHVEPLASLAQHGICSTYPLKILFSCMRGRDVLLEFLAEGAGTWMDKEVWFFSSQALGKFSTQRGAWNHLPSYSLLALARKSRVVFSPAFHPSGCCVLHTHTLFSSFVNRVGCGFISLEYRDGWETGAITLPSTSTPTPTTYSKCRKQFSPHSDHRTKPTKAAETCWKLWLLEFQEDNSSALKRGG